ncbi:hypothetical protein [Vibrio sp. VB16]|uniref:hypothetical protein n=1 Tax=Vibrio sp. VB16 TaxID=2785746 RepID=UPI00189FADEA|nr:hypothetical protein [Vibrio sp. VB16]UGA54853.1 hypothetical protein IUZ65_000270 [Vibrio sp. VB16]
MTKRLCKLNRREISEGLGEIYSLVSDAKYLCRSCARSSQDSSQLCKPTAIPPQACLSKSTEEKQQCVVLADTLPIPALPIPIDMLSEVTKKEVKKAKKQAKKQKKYVKKMASILDKQNKLLRKQKKIEEQFAKFNTFHNEMNLKSALH